MKLIFMGTPEFAVPALNAIIASESHDLMAVFTQKPKQSGRGMRINKSPVHNIAESNNIPVYTPDTLKSQQIYDIIKTLNPDAIIVVAYGFIIPKEIIEIPTFGGINIHPSQLPKYRGAAPLQHTILNGDKDSAVCLIQMTEELDSGDILIKQDIQIHERIEYDELHDLCANIGADLLVKLLDNINYIKKTPQSKIGVSYAKKLTNEDKKIDWNNSAIAIDRQIRAINNTYFMHEGKRIKVISAQSVNAFQTNHSSDIFDNKFSNSQDSIEFEKQCKINKYKIGQVINNQFHVACGVGVIHIINIQPEGRTRMSSQDYLNGIKFNSQKDTILLT